MPLFRCGARELSGPSLLCVHLKYRHRSIDVIMLRLRAPSRLSAGSLSSGSPTNFEWRSRWSPSIPETQFERRLPVAASRRLSNLAVEQCNDPLLPASWIRLARDANRCGRRYGRRPHSQRVHPHAAASKEPVLRNDRSILRKGAEFTLVSVTELVLGKQRILELYFNVVEWGPGVYGAESACRYYYRTSARNIDRQQSAQLAAILPLPLKRRPDHMIHYSGLILERMRQVGW